MKRLQRTGSARSKSTPTSTNKTVTSNQQEHDTTKPTVLLSQGHPNNPVNTSKQSTVNLDSVAVPRKQSTKRKFLLKEYVEGKSPQLDENDIKFMEKKPKTMLKIDIPGASEP